jgi:dihydroorotate dehydrogenase (fumarate)
MNLSPCIIGGVQFSHPIYNASGVRCTSYDDLDFLNDTYSSAILTKSCTLHPHKGNPIPNYFTDDHNSINRNGLCNEGIDYYTNYKKRSNKPYIISVAGFNDDERIKCFNIINDRKSCDLIELNLSCPNLGIDATAYDFEYMGSLLRKLQEINNIPLGVKIPPYLRKSEIIKTSDLFIDNNIKFITCINSIPNTFISDNIYGGYGGPAIKPIALSIVKSYFNSLNGKISIIGCGGITSITDVHDYLQNGATAVQIGTSFHNCKHIFESILTGKANDVARTWH